MLPLHEWIDFTSDWLPLTWGCEGTWECQVAWHLSPALVLSFPSVSHSGKCWFFSQDAQLPHGGVIYSRMTQMSHIGTWQDPQLETPLPSCPTTADAVVRETGLCWHHRIWSDLPWRPNPRYAQDPTSRRLVRHCQPPAVCCGQQCELNTHAHVFREDMPECVRVFYCCITKTPHRSIMIWTLLSRKHYTGALTCRVDMYELLGIL